MNTPNDWNKYSDEICLAALNAVLLFNTYSFGLTQIKSQSNSTKISKKNKKTLNANDILNKDDVISEIYIKAMQYILNKYKELKSFQAYKIYSGIYKQHWSKTVSLMKVIKQFCGEASELGLINLSVQQGSGKTIFKATFSINKISEIHLTDDKQSKLETFLQKCGTTIQGYSSVFGLSELNVLLAKKIISKQNQG